MSEQYRTKKFKLHRYIMEQHLIKKNPESPFLVKIDGILKLNPNLIVHHINRNKYDNRIKNLEIITKSKHASIHNEDRTENKIKIFGVQTDTSTVENSDNEHSHPIISLGNVEKKIVTYLNKLNDERLNIKSFARQSGILRSTIYYNLDNLVRKKLVAKEILCNGYSNYKISEKGKELIKIWGTDSSVNSVRNQCQAEQLSTHFFKYSVKIKDINLIKLNELTPNEIKENKLVNFTEYYLYYEDCTITVKKNIAIMHIHDIIASDIDAAHWIAFNKALVYLIELKKIASIEGLIVFGKPHYARVQSYLSDKISKIDNKYKLNFKDGTSFWIDYSDKREDETDNPLYRARIDDVFLDMKDSKAVFSDVDRHEVNLMDVKEISKNQVAITSNLLQLQINQLNMGNEIEVKKKDGIDKSLNNYFG